MRVQSTLRLDHAERRVVQAAAVHVRIAVPDDETDDELVRGRRALSHIGKGDVVTREIAERAERVLDLLAERCHRESDPAYWESELAPRPTEYEGGVTRPITHDPEANRTHDRIEAERGVPLAVDGVALRVLPEARRSQAREAREALYLVRDALTLLPPRPTFRPTQWSVQPDDD